MRSLSSSSEAFKVSGPSEGVNSVRDEWLPPRLDLTKAILKIINAMIAAIAIHTQRFPTVIKGVVRDLLIGDFEVGFNFCVSV